MDALQAVQFDDLPWMKLGAHREYNLRIKTLLRGEEGARDNFRLTYSEGTGGIQTGPRHKHNFDQVRVPLSGKIHYGGDRYIETGDVGYFPEGLHYGPTEEDMVPGKAQIVLQAGGASGLGYLSSFQTKKAQEELAQVGTFKDGLFHWPSQHPVNPGKVQDAYEALWEHVHQREIEYPVPRYADQVIMSPAAFAWAPKEGQPNVQIKPLGRFTEKAFEVDMVKIEAGKAATLEPSRSVRVGFIMEGAGKLEDRLLSRHGAFSIAKGNGAHFESDGDLEFILFSLPKF